MCSTKICKRCNKEQSIDNFYKVPSMKDGHDNTCKTCRKELRRLRDGVKVTPIVTEIQQQKKASRERNIEQAMLTSAKNRAARKGLEFNLELSDIVIPEKCPLLEVPFHFGTKECYDYSPSIDRIDNSKGYVKGNIQIISMKANAMKNSASLEELYTFCKNILRYSPNCTEQVQN